jgi:hypothetical protein
VFCFPHADDYRGCDVCGLRYCERCGAELSGTCQECGGRLHANQTFPATGTYRLPPSIRRLAGTTERRAAVQSMWDRGYIASMDRDYLLAVIDELDT